MTSTADAGLKELKDLKQLTSLNLSHRKVTDAGLKELKDLNKLTSLSLAFTQVTDAGLKELKDLKKLASLNLIHVKVTDDGVAAFRKALPAARSASESEARKLASPIRSVRSPLKVTVGAPTGSAQADVCHGLRPRGTRIAATPATLL